MSSEWPFRAVLRLTPVFFQVPLTSSNSSMLSKFWPLVCPPTTTTLPSSSAILCLNLPCTKSAAWITSQVEGSTFQVEADRLLLGSLPPVIRIWPLRSRQSGEEAIIGLDKVKLVHLQLDVLNTRLLFFSSPPMTANLVSEMATVQAYIAPGLGIFDPSLQARVCPTGRNSLDLESFLPPKMKVPEGRTTL